MKKIYIILFFICATTTFSTAEDNVEYKQIPIQFNRIESDSLDNYIKRLGKKNVLNNLDSNISNLSNLIKYSTKNIKEEDIAFQLIGLNKAYNLKLDSFLIFSEQINHNDLFFSAYDTILGNVAPIVENFKNILKDTINLKTQFYKSIYQKYGRIGFFTFCKYFNHLTDYTYLDTLYKAALIYPNNVKNEYYYALTEFDRNCGNATNNSKYYKDLLYNKMKDDMSLEIALTDTSEISSLNYTKYILTPKYQFLAYSLYAKNFDIKANQKEIIYFLTSQNKQDGGFKEFNLEKAEKTLKSKIEPTIYGFWALLELREQINALYPDDVIIKKPIPVDTTIKTPTKPAPKKK